MKAKDSFIEQGKTKRSILLCFSVTPGIKRTMAKFIDSSHSLRISDLSSGVIQEARQTSDRFFQSFSSPPTTSFILVVLWLKQSPLLPPSHTHLAGPFLLREFALLLDSTSLTPLRVALTLDILLIQSECSHQNSRYFSSPSSLL